MTREECIRQAIVRIIRFSPRSNTPEARDLFRKLALEILRPYIERDETYVDGKMVAEKWDPKTHESEPVEVQAHPPRRVAPFNFGPNEVLWLEREIRMRAQAV